MMGVGALLSSQAEAPGYSFSSPEESESVFVGSGYRQEPVVSLNYQSLGWLGLPPNLLVSCSSATVAR